jgi:phosphatidylglycerol---prolipoprotein diacylglyceryl transferase
MISPIIHHPLVIQLGPLSLTGFGIAVVSAFAVAQHLAETELTRRGHDARPIADMILAAVVGGLLGAKLYYVLVLHHYDALFTRGGFVFWGGLVGGMLAVMAVIRWKRIPMMRIFDVGGPAVAAAYAVGRTGCWAVGDDYGRPFSGFGAVMFPNGQPPSTVAAMTAEFHTKFAPGIAPSTVVSVYPTELYEITLATIMFLILWRMRDHKHAEGWLFGVYCVLAGFERFIIEFFRAKDDRFLGGLTYAQGIALAFVAMGLAWMYLRRDVGAKKPGIYAPGAGE